MRVVMASSEAAPLAKTGGLADVAGALPVALRSLGVDASLVVPAYPGAIERAAARSTGGRVDVRLSGRRVDAEVWEGALGDGTPVYLLHHPEYFERETLYGPGESAYGDNAERFAFFSRAVLALLDQIGPPDVLHCHDWQTALAPAFLRADRDRYPRLDHVRTVLTIHNLAYQGLFWAADWHLLELDWRYFTPQFLEFQGSINYLKAGLVFADALTTVSRTYAEEICQPELGHGLDGVLRERRAALRGIVNGADYREWSPDTDAHIARRYSADDASGKRPCKAALQADVGLPVEPSTPLYGIISRLTGQKGIDLVLEAAGALSSRGAQFVVLGTGEAALERALADLAQAEPRRWAARIGFDEGLAHRIQAGADMLLMPSRYEPCGLNQIYGLRYGTIPVVRATGGLRDTVEEFDPSRRSGTGFTFGPYDAGSLLAAIDKSLACHRDAEAWNTLLANAMRADFSWGRSAAEYRALYAELTGR